MPNYFPPQTPIRPTSPRAKTLRRYMRDSIRLRWLSACLLLVTACAAPAQTLARPGWDASGFNTDPWWKRAVFYDVKRRNSVPPTAASDFVNPQLPSTVDFAAITANLGAAQSLGVDALILPMPASQLPDATLDSFDELVRQASTRGIHVLLTISATSATSDLSAMARFWLSRGVSGFRIVTPPTTNAQDSQAIVRAVRKITSSTVGGRIILSDFPADASAYTAVATTPHRTRHTRNVAENRVEDSAGAQLLIDANPTPPGLPTAANLRPLLSSSQRDPNAILDLQTPTPATGSADPYSALQNVMAAIALTTRPAALIETGENLSAQPGATDSALTAFYRKLTAMHHGNATLRYGSVTTLDFDAQNALVWVSRPASKSRLAAPVVVACNLSSSPVRLSLGAAMKGLDLHGFYLRTLLRTDKAMGAQDIDSVTLPPFGVYIGELHR